MVNPSSVLTTIVGTLVSPKISSHSPGRAGRHRIRRFLVGIVDIRDAVRQCCEALVLEQIFATRQLAEQAPVVVEIRQDRNIAVLGLVRLPVITHQAFVTGTAERRLERHAPQVLGHDPVDHRLEHRHLDRLALAGLLAMIECGGHGEHDRHCGRLVRHDGRQVTRLAEHHFLQHRDTAGGLDRVVERALGAIRAVFAVAVATAIDNSRIHLLEVVVVQGQLRHRLRPVVVDHDVHLFRDLENGLAARLLFQVEHDAAFVAIAGQVQRRHARRVRCTERPVAVAVRGFHLDDLGAHVRQHLARKRSEYDRREFEDLDAFQWTRHVLLPPNSGRLLYRPCLQGQVPAQAGDTATRGLAVPQVRLAATRPIAGQDFFD